MLYVAVSLVLTGVVSYTQLGVPHPIAVGVEATGQRWLATVVEIGGRFHTFFCYRQSFDFRRNSARGYRYQ